MHATSETQSPGGGWLILYHGDDDLGDRGATEGDSGGAPFQKKIERVKAVICLYLQEQN
jgi:hypothetical protein